MKNWQLLVIVLSNLLVLVAQGHMTYNVQLTKTNPYFHTVSMVIIMLGISYISLLLVLYKPKPKPVKEAKPKKLQPAISRNDLEKLCAKMAKEYLDKYPHFKRRVDNAKDTNTAYMDIAIEVLENNKPNYSEVEI